MHASVTVGPARLGELLLNVATVRPVFVWGPPGIGKSTLVNEFADALGTFHRVPRSGPVGPV